MKKLLLFTSLLFGLTRAEAQSFEKILYSSYYDVGTDAIQTPSGDYVVAGWSSANGTGLSDFILAKFDANGMLIWQKDFGGPADELMPKLSITSDNKYLLVGKSTSFGNASGGIFLYKFDENGNKLWSRFFESTNPTTSTYLEPTSITPIVDGGFLISGYHSVTQSALMMRIDSLGNLNFGRTYNNLNEYGSTGDCRANKVIIASDQNYVMTGRAWGWGSTLADILIAKFNQQGDTIWQKRFGGTNWEEGNDIIETEDFGFVIVGYTYSYGSGLKDVIIVKTDFMGQILWTQVFGGPDDDEAYSIAELPGGNLIVTGYANGSSSDKDMLLLKFDKNGNFIYGKTMDGGYSGLYDIANSVRYYNNKLIISGQMNGGFDDIYLAVSDTNLSSLCNWVPSGNLPSTNLMITYPVTFLTDLISINFTPLDTVFSVQLVDSNFCQITGILSQELSHETIDIYPNPFSKQTTLFADKNLYNATLIVDNVFGQTVTQIKNINGRSIVLKRENLPSGLYFVQLTEENKIIAVDKIVITD